MNKIAVVYKSKYGSTEIYARWIAEDAPADLYRVQDVSVETLAPYQTIVYCGGMYAGGVLGFSFIRKHFEELSGKKILLVAVGATLNKTEDMEEARNHNLSGDMRGRVSFFKLRGILNYKKMNAFHRFVLFLMVSALKKKKEEELDEDGRGMIESYGKVADFTDRESIKPILEALA